MIHYLLFIVMGNYNFTQMMFAFCVGFAVMFVLSVKEIENFKGCNYESWNYWPGDNGGGNVSSYDEGRTRNMGVQ